ncbi:MAG: hypothetical protein Q8K97_12485 [Pseudohongiella sp.]|nr:hypothetical protein [Pseudohongiella sp.]
MQLRNFFAQDRQGNVIPSATVYIYMPGTTTNATGLQNKAGAGITSPLTADIDGKVSLRAPSAEYDVRIVGGGRDFTIEGVQFLDVIEQVTTATAQAVIATTKATEAAASAALAEAVALGVSSGRPTIRPSLLLDFANTKQLDPRITFARASAGVYYDGITTVKAEENLYIKASDLNNAAWGTPNASKGAGVAAPDGTMTSIKLIENVTVNGGHYFDQVISVSGKTATYSIYAKAAERTWIAVITCDGGYIFNYFDIGNGVLGTIDGGNVAHIEDAGDGWYRIDITRTYASGLAFIQLILAESDGVNNYDGDGTSGLYLWHPQLELRDSVTAFTPTDDKPITNYIPKLLTADANVPRLNHDPVTGRSLGLVREGAATNLLTYSEQFDNGSWVKTSLAIKANQMVAPDGSLGFDALTETAENEQHSLYEIIAALPVGTYTFSVFVSKTFIGNRNFCVVPFSTGGVGGTGAKGVIFNQQGEFVGFTTGDAEPSYKVVDLGYCYRVSVTGYTTNETTVYPVISLRDGLAQVYTGDGVSTMYVWGAQFEAGSKATSYTKTEASTVTRAADVVEMTGDNFSSWYNPAEGTFYFETDDYDGDSSSRGWLSAHSGTLTNSINMYQVGGSLSLDFYNETQQAVFNPVFSRHAALAYKTNNSAGAAGNILTDSSCLSPAGINQLIIGSTYAGNSFPLNGTIKKLAYYPMRLSNAELQVLTQ